MDLKKMLLVLGEAIDAAKKIVDANR